MKRYILYNFKLKIFIIFFSFLVAPIFGQLPNDCVNSIITCGNSNVNLDVNGIGVQELSGVACSSQENNSIWLKVTVATGGTLGFILTPNNTSISEDYDFWGFGPNVSCGNIGNSIRCSTTNPIAANQGNNLTGLKDVVDDETSEGPGGDGDSFVEWLTVQPDETYFFVIDRPIGNSPFSLEWIGTATFYEAPSDESTVNIDLSYENCDLNNNGKSFFDLTQDESSVVGTQIVNVTYHNNISDAQIGINPISEPENFESVTSTRYMRLTDSVTGCFSVFDINLKVFENPIFDIIEDTKYICTNLTNQVTTFELENIKDNYTFSWKDSNENELSTTTTLDVTEIGDYTATTINGNCSITKTVHLLPAESAEIIDFEINEYWQHDNFSIDLEIKGDGIFQYAIDDINGPYQDESTFINIKPGIHTIYIKEIYNCGITSKIITIFGFRPYFSPNGDESHDVWKVQGINFNAKAKIYIFNRFGKVMYQFYPALNQGWNGYYNGKPAPEGEYWFTAEMKDFKGKAIIRKGHFSLKRTNK